jgi:hypothetical protein
MWCCSFGGLYVTVISINLEDAFFRKDEFNLPHMYFGWLQNFWRFYNRTFNWSKIFFALTFPDFKTFDSLSACYNTFVAKFIY